MGENLKESLRWFKQAEKDLKVAKNSIHWKSLIVWLRKGTFMKDAVREGALV